ncbi:sulfur oxidation c-type cytochrome SoxA [Thioalkalivibrio sulfidiphilus]|nr:sulfur oxidation c-type cytochrome SoxA [Thioalkalivibrio sulfidiphilus]
MKALKLAPLALGVVVATSMSVGLAQGLSVHLERSVVGPGPDYWPNREKAIPHVSGDEAFSNTYQYWKDAEAIAAARQEGRMSHEMNFKDFRWLERSMEGEELAERGSELFHRKNQNGQSCASCHGDNGEKISDAQSRFPAFNKRLGRVVTMPTQIGSCASERLGENWVEDTKENSLIGMYVATLADGVPVNIDVSGGEMKASYERGRDLFFKRTGHFNFACASCHTPPTSGSYLRIQRPTTFFGDAAQYPVYHFPYSLPGDDLEYIFTLQHQIKSCQILSRMYPGVEGSEPMTDIEVFLQASSNGFPISAPVNFYNLDAGYME